MKIKNKIKFLASIFILAFVFVTLLIGLEKDNFYLPEKNLENKIINFYGNDLFTNEKFEFKNSNLNNKFTIINIWASWCAPCKSEHKFISELSKNKNFSIFS